MAFESNLDCIVDILMILALCTSEAAAGVKGAYSYPKSKLKLLDLRTHKSTTQRYLLAFWIAELRSTIPVAINVTDLLRIL